MGLAEATKVIDWQITSSPAATPNWINAKCNAAVPDESTATCTPSPRYCSKSLSNPFTFGPSGATQLSSKASWMKFISAPPIWGDESQILGFIVQNFKKVLLLII